MDDTYITDREFAIRLDVLENDYFYNPDGSGREAMRVSAIDTMFGDDRIILVPPGGNVTVILEDLDKITVFSNGFVYYYPSDFVKFDSESGVGVLDIITMTTMFKYVATNGISNDNAGDDDVSDVAEVEIRVIVCPKGFFGPQCDKSDPWSVDIAAVVVVAADDSYVTDRSSVLQFNVLVNDFFNDPNGADALRVSSVDPTGDGVDFVPVPVGGEVKLVLAEGGNITVSSDGSINFYPSDGINQGILDNEEVVETFLYEATNGELNDIAEVEIRVIVCPKGFSGPQCDNFDAANLGIVAADDSYVTDRSSVFHFNVLENDFFNDPNGADALRVSSVDPTGDGVDFVPVPVGGEVKLVLDEGGNITVSSDGSINFYPSDGLNRGRLDNEEVVETFLYEATNGELSDIAEVEIRVIACPRGFFGPQCDNSVAANEGIVAVDDSYNTDGQSTLRFNVLENDSTNDPNGADTLRVSSVDPFGDGDDFQPIPPNSKVTVALIEGGNITVSSDGFVDYNFEPPGYPGEFVKSFLYEVTNGEISDFAEVKISVEVVDSGPAATAAAVLAPQDDFYETDRSSSIRFNVLDNDSVGRETEAPLRVSTIDPVGKRESVTIPPGETLNIDLNPGIIKVSSAGFIDFYPKGGQFDVDPDSGNLTDFSEDFVVQFAYEAQDEDGIAAMALVTIRVTNDPCPLTCNNGGKCHPGPANYGIVSLYPYLSPAEFVMPWEEGGNSCLCPDGVAGHDCDHPYELCAPDTAGASDQNDAFFACFHGGKCMEGEGQWECDCSDAGWNPAGGSDEGGEGLLYPVAGRHCEYRAQQLCHIDGRNMFCVNGGMCIKNER